MNGVWPQKVDHINGNKIDNRYINSREVNTIENARNQKISSRNTSGVTGVRYHKNQNKWIANITVKGKLIHLGTFDDIQEAIKLRKAAEIEYGFHENHGRLQDAI